MCRDCWGSLFREKHLLRTSSQERAFFSTAGRAEYISRGEKNYSVPPLLGKNSLGRSTKEDFLSGKRAGTTARWGRLREPLCRGGAARKRNTGVLCRRENRCLLCAGKDPVHRARLSKVPRGSRGPSTKHEGVRGGDLASDGAHPRREPSGGGPSPAGRNSSFRGGGADYAVWGTHHTRGAVPPPRLWIVFFFFLF